MSHLVLRRSRQLAATTVAGAVAGVALVAVAAPQAQAATTGTVEGGSVSWGLSTYLNSANFGRPNPKADAYVAPAAFDPATRISSWGGATGTLAGDGSADLAFDGTSVNFAGTGGGWLRLTDLEADLDASGNGAVSAVVEYGTSVTGTPPAMQYDPNQAPDRGPERVDLVDLAGNTAADVVRGDAGAVTWTGLDGTWSSELTTFLNGDESAEIPAWSYASTVSAAEGRAPLPFTFTLDTVAPDVTVAQTSATVEDGVTFSVEGTGFRAVTNPGDNGVYVGLAPSGGLPDVSSPEGIANFAAASAVFAPQIQDGSFTTTLNATADKLDPSESYSVYTWQAHAHSNTTQDTETPVDIPFGAITPVGAPELTYVGTHTSRHASTGWIGVDVTNVEDGAAWVEMTGFGARKTLNVRGGQALFKIPANAPKGTYQATFTLHTYEEGAVGDGTSLTKTFVVKAGQTAGTVAVTRAPTPRAKGTVDLAVRHLGNATLHAPRPSGQFTVKVYAESGPLRWQSAKLWMSNGARNGLELPALPSGRYLVHLTYHGSGTSLASTSSQWVTVR